MLTASMPEEKARHRKGVPGRKSKTESRVVAVMRSKQSVSNYDTRVTFLETVLCLGKAGDKMIIFMLN